jgi:uncharacterized protein YkwD
MGSMRLRSPRPRPALATRWLTALLAATLLGSLLGAGASAASPAVVSAQAKIEHSIRGCANRNRQAAGLPPLQASEVLAKAARLQARNMAREGFFDHVDPQGRGPEDRVAIFDPEGRYTFVGENIAAGYGSARAACVGWMHSAGHRANILDPGYTMIGGGFARGGSYGRYYVQVFAQKEAPAPAEPEVELYVGHFG